MGAAASNAPLPRSASRPLAMMVHLSTSIVAWMVVVIVMAGFACEERPARYPGALTILRRPRRVSRG